MTNVNGPQPLQSRQPAPQDDVISTLIPYRNGMALAAYYVGIFSILPIIGALSGPAAIFLGIRGLMAANMNPSAKGKAHAWVGIICGALFGLLWIILDIVIIIGIIVAAGHR